MLRILMVVNGRQSVEQLAALASKWRAEQYAESVFWLAHPDDRVHASTLRASGFGVDGPGSAATSTTPAPATETEKAAAREDPIAQPPRHSQRGRVWAAFISPIVQMLRTAYRGRRERAACRRRLVALGVAAVVTSQERPFSFLPLVAAAGDLRMPVVLIPANFICEADGGAFMRRHDKSLLPDLPFRDAWNAGVPLVWAMNRLMRRLKPRQIFNSRFGAMLCYPGDYLMGLWLGGLLTGNMWHQGTRFVDRVVISGDEEAAVCARAGLPAERVAKIGNPVFEALMERVPQRGQIRRQLADRFGLDPLKKIVILSVPSLWEHKMISREEQVAVLEQILSALREHDVAVVLSLHPRSHADDYRDVAGRFATPLLDRPLMDVLVGADAFVASAYSSTIRWALALGLPAVNLDFWNLNDRTYAEYPSYPKVQDLDGLRQWLGVVLQSPWQGPDWLNVPDRNALGIVVRARFSDGLRQLIDQLMVQLGELNVVGHRHRSIPPTTFRA